MQAYVPLVRSRARYVAAHATDDRDPTQPAFIRRRTTRVHPRGSARRTRFTERTLYQRGVLTLKLGPLNCGEES